jgi:hypothetical protein
MDATWNMRFDGAATAPTVPNHQWRAVFSVLGASRASAKKQQPSAEARLAASTATITSADAGVRAVFDID